MSESESVREPLEWRLRAIVGEENVLVDEPMCEHTTFEVGGPADLYVIPESFDEVRDVLLACDEAGVERFVLGRGSDLLVSDDGYRGVIVAVGEGLMGVSVDGTEMTCQAGVDLCEASEMLMPDGSQDTIDAADLDLGYRRSRVAADGLVVLSATFALEKGDPEKIRAKMDDFTQRREEKQPLEMASAGSTFKRPEGYFAGKLIMDAGLQGYRVGAAEVSRKHAGFVVNTGGATAADVRAVIEHVQDEVERQFGVRLEPEVRFLG